MPPVEGVPVGTPVSAAAELSAFKLALEVAGRHELERLSGEMKRSARSAVERSVAKSLPPALADFIARSDAVRTLAREVELSVEREAHGVVRRLASDEVASRALASAVEARCMVRIDERMRATTWGAGALGALGGAAAAAACWWFGFGPRQR